MAHTAGSDSRPHLTVAPLQHQISKDAQGVDFPVPLSPQWLLPKTGDSKLGVASGEGHLAPFTAPLSLSESKLSGNGEAQKKKDVFRPSLFDMETGRRDRWRDEERDANASIRRDLWRDGDRELGGNRKVEHWENPSAKPFGEARRVPSERRTDYGNRGNNNNLQRESKWNTRWGPDDKVVEGSLEKYANSGKNSDTAMEKSVPYLSNHMKDEKAADHFRPWRGASMQARARGEPHHSQSPASNKHVPAFSGGRGWGENMPPTSVGHGGIGSVGYSIHANQPLEASFDKGDIGHGEAFKYNRMKLLDVYRTTDMRSYRNLKDELVQLPALTQEEPLEPLALCAPSMEEMDVLKGIDIGDVVSSGAPQITKDGSFGRSMDFSLSRRANFGSREDIPLPPDDPRNSKGPYGDSVDSFPHDQQKQYYKSSFTMQMTHDSRIDQNSNSKDAGSGEESYAKDDRGNTKEELIMQGGSSVDAVRTWHADSLEDGSLDWSKIPDEVQFKKLGTAWAHPQKGGNDGWTSHLAKPSYFKEEEQRMIHGDSLMTRQAPAFLSREQEARNLHTPPENLSLYYRDPQGAIQGPFSGSDIIGWFEAGYFGIDLQVRLVNAPSDSAFSLLGDVMPHLRVKARPPPGFKAASENEIVEPAVRADLSGGNVRAGLTGIDLISNELRHKSSVSATEAENRFLESLMSGNTSSRPVENFTFVEGLQGYMERHPAGGPSLAVDGGDPYLLAKRIALEKQRSMHNPYPHIGRDTVRPPSEIVHNSHAHPTILSSTADNSKLPQSQNADLMSILQGLPERPFPGINNVAANWSSFPAQGSLNTIQDQIGLHPPHNFPSQALFGLQQQRLQSHTQHPLTNLLPQSLDNASANMAPDKLISSGSLEDPQVLSMLQQQHLMRLHSQAPAPVQQLSMLDKLLLLKQQEQEQQQQHLLRQQQLLSQVLLNNQSGQQFLGSSYPHLQMGNTSMDIQQKPSQELLHPSMHESSSNFPNLPAEVSQNPYRGPVNHHVGSAAPDENGDYQKEQLPSSTVVEINPPLDISDRSSVEGPHVLPTIDSEVQNRRSSATVQLAIEPSESIVDSVPCESPENALFVPSPETCENDVPKIHADAMIQKEGTVDKMVHEEEKSRDEPAVVSEVKSVEESEVKKVSEKKSRKQKSAKSSSVTDQTKPLKSIPLQQLMPSEADGQHFGGMESDARTGAGEELGKSVPQRIAQSTDIQELIDSQHIKNPMAEASSHTPGKAEVKVNSQPNEPILAQSAQFQPGQRVWKAPTAFKAKSLVEIQQEEQRKAQVEVAVSEITSSVSSMSVSTPWAGVAANLETKASGNASVDAGDTVPRTDRNVMPLSSGVRKSQLHDVLAEEELPKVSYQVEVPVTSTVAEEEDDFIEAKETKKSRKRSAKAKTGGTKVSVSVASDAPTMSSPFERSKTTRAIQQDKEVLPAIPSGPSLGDFVPWKGEAANSSPSPAWSIDAGKFAKPTSLRDILKEQEKKVSSVQSHQMPTPQRSQPIPAARGASRSLSGSSAAKAASPSQVNSITSSQSKYKGDDDLFWGPIDQSREAGNQPDFPQLANYGGRVTKSTPVKGTPGGSLSREKSAGVARQLETSLSSSPASAQSPLKGKRDAMNKHSEAMDFRDWCQNECVRLLGTTDTSFLEFCLKQSRSEAEMLLIENLGSFDPDHAFIDKFLNYKELLPADVLEIAFQIPSTHRATGFNHIEATNKSDHRITGDSEAALEGSSKGSKKKGKKGKKVSPAVLGFNVVSNRIMMGEIQTVED